MSPTAPRREVIQRRLREMRGLLDYFSGLGDLDASELEGNIERRMAVERGLTQLVDLAVKINSSIVTAVRGVPPPDYHRSFIHAGEVGIIPADLAVRLAPSGACATDSSTSTRPSTTHRWPTPHDLQPSTMVNTYAPSRRTSSAAALVKRPAESRRTGERAILDVLALRIPDSRAG